MPAEVLQRRERGEQRDAAHARREHEPVGGHDHERQEERDVRGREQQVHGLEAAQRVDRSAQHRRQPREAQVAPEHVGRQAGGHELEQRGGRVHPGRRAEQDRQQDGGEEHG
jgi:hypothetical protein